MTERKHFIVKTETVEDAVTQLPPLVDWDGSIEGDIDLLIVSRGFEDRVCAFPDAMVKSGINVRGAILLGHYRTNQSDNDRRAVELMRHLDAISTVPYCHCDAETPSSVRDAINIALDSIEVDQVHVVIDISAASSTLILSSMLSLLSLNRRIKLTVLYATAAEYHEPKADGKDQQPLLWDEVSQREHGVSDVGKNELQNGFHHDHLPAYAIVIPSMFGSRLQRCLGYLGLEFHDTEEQEVYWLLPSTDSKDHSWRHDAVMRTVMAITHCEVSDGAAGLPAGSWGRCGALDYRECTRLLMKEMECRVGRNISLVHMGTKLQALGVALALGARPEVALVHARPLMFSAQSYSKRVGTLHKIVFEDLLEDLKRLSQVGSLTIESLDYD